MIFANRMKKPDMRDIFLRKSWFRLPFGDLDDGDRGSVAHSKQYLFGTIIITVIDVSSDFFFF